jgi:A/G-specific adenine glycosylase
MMAVGNKIDALPIKEEKVHEFVDRLTEWGEKNLRSFPWRRTSDPYRILLAEVMLHRTKAEQVAPVYLSFIDVYPSPEVLAKTPLRKISSSLRPLGLA